MALILYTSNCKAVIAIVRVLNIGAGGCEKSILVSLGKTFHLSAFFDLSSSLFIARWTCFNFGLVEQTAEIGDGS